MNKFSILLFFTTFLFNGPLFSTELKTSYKWERSNAFLATANSQKENNSALFTYKVIQLKGICLQPEYDRVSTKQNGKLYYIINR